MKLLPLSEGMHNEMNRWYKGNFYNVNHYSSAISLYFGIDFHSLLLLLLS
jgi:hypothetical protein